jgi:hypothetical protein
MMYSTLNESLTHTGTPRCSLSCCTGNSLVAGNRVRVAPDVFQDYSYLVGNDYQPDDEKFATVADVVVEEFYLSHTHHSSLSLQKHAFILLLVISFFSRLFGWIRYDNQSRRLMQLGSITISNRMK